MERPSLRWIALCIGLSSLGLGGCGGKADLKFVGAPDTSSCGDETVDADEKCDDGNTTDGDGCSKECQPEPGYVCVGKRNSSCAKTCGNDKLDEGEACEDGNTTKGDGCDASCQIEGSCEEPLVLDISSGKATIDSSLNGGGGGAKKAACGDGDAGDGPDRVFQFELESASDLAISLSSSFNGVVRLQSAACDAESETGCQNAEGAGATETLNFRDVAAGTYFVVVDSVGTTAAGDFTLNVTASCPLSGLKLQEIAYGALGSAGGRYITLTNRGSCGVDLSKFVVGTRNYSTATMKNTKLPKKTLAGGKTFTLSSDGEDLTPPADLNASSVYFNPTESDVSLCLGNCDASDGSNVVDYFVNGYLSGSDVYAPPIPDGLTFTGGPLTSLTGANSYYMVHRRAKFAGKYPKFAAADWKSGVSFDPDRGAVSASSALSNFSYSVSGTPTCTIVDDAAPAPNEGRYLVVTPGGASEQQGCYIYVGTTFRPKTVTYRGLSSGTSAYGGGVRLANNYKPAASWWASDTTITWFFADYFAYGYSWVYANNSYLQYNPPTDVVAPTTWFDLEQTIDWTAGTLDVSVDGNVWVTDHVFDNTRNVSYIQFESNYLDSTFQLAKFEAFD